MSLNKKLFVSPKMIPTRDGYGQGLVELGKTNKKVVVLCCDLTESTRSLEFKKQFPSRFIEMGIQEQNMAGVASGLAQEGLIPFISSYAVFSPGHNWGQMRVSIAYNNANVKIAGAHTGISIGPDGATHQALEDIAIMRVLPNVTILSPCDVYETKKATIAAANHNGPVYIRFTREKTPIITSEKTPFQIGKAYIMRKGSDATFIATGPILYEALLAAEILAGNKEVLKTVLSRYPSITKHITSPISSYTKRHNSKQNFIWSVPLILALLKKTGKRNIEVINCPTIKPLDQKTILTSLKKTKRAITIEEHQTKGGLFGEIAELTARQCPIHISAIGMNDMFGESGEPLELLEKYEMTAPWIIQSLLKIV